MDEYPVFKKGQDEEPDERESFFEFATKPKPDKSKEEKPDKKTAEAEGETEERNERNGSIFAWLLARIRTEKPEEYLEDADEEQIERTLEEAENAVHEAEVLVELRHDHEEAHDEGNDGGEEVDYDAEFAVAEEVRQTSREVIERRAISSDNYYDPGGGADAYAAKTETRVITKTETKKVVRESQSSSWFDSYQVRKQKKLEKKLKKEAVKYKKRLRKLEAKVNKVQEAKINKLVGRIHDLETDRHDFAPPPVPKPVIQEKVIIQKIVERTVEPKSKQTNKPNATVESRKHQQTEPEITKEKSNENFKQQAKPEILSERADSSSAEPKNTAEIKEKHEAKTAPSFGSRHLDSAISEQADQRLEDEHQTDEQEDQRHAQAVKPVKTQAQAQSIFVVAVILLAVILLVALG
jgi:hypothetical protein